jgi:hypothetical protein
MIAGTCLLSPSGASKLKEGAIEHYKVLMTIFA